MPSMSATRITRIRRCSARSNSGSTGGAGRGHGRCQEPRASSMSRSNEAENRPRRAPNRARSSSSQPSSSRSSQARLAFSTRSRVRRPARGQRDARGPAVGGIGVADHEPVAFELLDLAGHRRGVHIEHLGQGRDPDGVAVDVELVEGGGPGPVEPDPRRLQQALVHPHLADGPGHHLQAGLDLVDRHIGGGRPRGPRRRRSASAATYLLAACNYYATAAERAVQSDPGHNVCAKRARPGKHSRSRTGGRTAPPAVLAPTPVGESRAGGPSADTDALQVAPVATLGRGVEPAQCRK